MKALRVTNEWLKWFYSGRIEIVTTIDNREMFTKTINGDIQGNHLNYNLIFKLIDSFRDAFTFLKIENIRLNWSDKLEKDKLQAYNHLDNYKRWKENVMKGGYQLENLFGSDYEDSTDIYFNYSVEADGKELSLYKDKQSDRAAIYIWYNPKTNITSYIINIELRTSLFSIDKNFEVQLPINHLEQNKILLDLVDSDFMLPI